MAIEPTHIQTLARAVTAALDSDRIGHLVFVRWTERVDSESTAATARALKIVSGWYGGEPVFTHAPEGSELQSTVLARWPEGQSALLIAAPVSFMDAPGLDLAVIGSKGAIYHDV